jgi:hypothetical protein
VNDCCPTLWCGNTVILCYLWLQIPCSVQYSRLQLRISESYLFLLLNSMSSIQVPADGIMVERRCLSIKSEKTGEHDPVRLGNLWCSSPVSLHLDWEIELLCLEVLGHQQFTIIVRCKPLLIRVCLILKTFWSLNPVHENAKFNFLMEHVLCHDRRYS